MMIHDDDSWQFMFHDDDDGNLHLLQHEQLWVLNNHFPFFHILLKFHVLAIKSISFFKVLAKKACFDTW